MKTEDLLEKICEKRGSLAAIHFSFSEFPVAIEAHFEFYEKVLLQDGLPLSRVEREWLAVETSRANACPYCIGHHSQALDNHLKEDKSLLENQRRELFSNFAKTLTLEPWKASLFQKKFLDQGLTQAQWQHAVFVVGYFNMANRLAHAMDLELEPDFQTSCK
jgi:uncharacterized peroxidase-related enzyme